MGESGCDVKLSSLGKSKFPFAVECKNQENLNIWSALKQAESHADKSNTIPLVVFTRNHTPVYVALPLDDFLLIQGASAAKLIPGGYEEEPSGCPGYAGDPPGSRPIDDYDFMMQRAHRDLDRIKKGR